MATTHRIGHHHPHLAVWFHRTKAIKTLQEVSTWAQKASRYRSGKSVQSEMNQRRNQRMQTQLVCYLEVAVHLTGQMFELKCQR